MRFSSTLAYTVTRPCWMRATPAWKNPTPERPVPRAASRASIDSTGNSGAPAGERKRRERTTIEAEEPAVAANPERAVGTLRQPS